LLVRVEVDAKRMSVTAFNSLSNWAAILSLGTHFIAGIGLGIIYFRGLRWNARLFADGASPALTIGLLIGRFLLMGSLLALASLEGAMPLLIMALGVLVARPMVTYRLRGPAS
jgi:F1F0 ATPase subunit 2